MLFIFFSAIRKQTNSQTSVKNKSEIAFQNIEDLLDDCVGFHSKIFKNSVSQSEKEQDTDHFVYFDVWQ